MKLLWLLNQPFPANYILNNRFKFVGGFSLFIIAFLYFYEPFGIHRIPKADRTLVIIGYGVVCFIIFLLDTLYVPAVFAPHFRDGRWKIYKQIFFTMYTLVTVTTGVVLYNHFVGILKFDLNSFFRMLSRNIAVGAIPAAISAVLVYNLELQKNLKEALKLQLALEMGSKKWTDLSPDGKVVLSDVLGKELISLQPKTLLLVRSADNYIEIFWRDGSESVKHTLLRQTMKHAEERLLNHHYFFRCHRTSIVNLSAIKTITGNSVGCKLAIEGIVEEVPVSRQNRERLYELLSSEKSAA